MCVTNPTATVLQEYGGRGSTRGLTPASAGPHSLESIRTANLHAGRRRVIIG